MVNEFLSARQFRQDAKIVFNSPQGRRCLSYLMKVGCVTTPVATADPSQTLRNEGMQHLVLSILRATYRNDTELEQHIEEQMQ